LSKHIGKIGKEKKDTKRTFLVLKLISFFLLFLWKVVKIGNESSLSLFGTLFSTSKAWI
jgi:hypothetical protein